METHMTEPRPVLTQDQKDLIRDIAWQVADALQKRLEDRMDEKIAAHSNACETVKMVGRATGGWKAIAIFMSALATILSIYAAVRAAH
jgi:hypothetical protein